MHASTTDVAATSTEAPAGRTDWNSAGERQEAARQAYRRSITAGRPLTGVALGEMFGLSARWGTERTAEVRTEMAAALRNGNGVGQPGAVRHLPIGRPPARPDAAGAERSAGQRDGGDPADSTGSVAADQHAVTPAPAAEPQTSETAALPSAGWSAATTAGPPAESDAAAAVPHAGWERHALTAGKAAVRLVAAALSYEHMRTVAEAAGEAGWRALLLPISVDGLAVLALVTMRTQRREGQRPTGWAWAALVLALAASLAANVASAEPTLAGRLVAAWPPVALFLAEAMDRPRHARPPPAHTEHPHSADRRESAPPTGRKRHDRP